MIFFFDFLLMFAGATAGILIVLVPTLFTSYVVYRFYLNLQLRKIQKREKKLLEEEVNRQQQETDKEMQYP